VLLIGTIDDSWKIIIWLNIKDCNWAIHNGVHITPNLLISSCLESNSFHGLSYPIMSYLIIDLVNWCRKTLNIPTRGVICVHIFMCAILLISIVLGVNLVVHDTLATFNNGVKRHSRKYPMNLLIELQRSFISLLTRPQNFFCLSLLLFF
jgi:hypothetical protein